MGSRSSNQLLNIPPLTYEQIRTTRHPRKASYYERAQNQQEKEKGNLRGTDTAREEKLKKIINIRELEDDTGIIKQIILAAI